MTALRLQPPTLDILYYSVMGVIAMAVFILFIVEIAAKLNDVHNDNVNIIIREWSYHKFYFITFFFGVVAGHLFLGGTSRLIDCKKLGMTMECGIFDVIVVAGLSLLLLVTGLIFQKNRTSTRFQVIVFTAGLLVGHFVWSMNHVIK